MRHKWLLINGVIVRPKPGFIFEVKEVPLPPEPMTDAELRAKGVPNWPHKMVE